MWWGEREWGERKREKDKERERTEFLRKKKRETKRVIERQNIGIKKPGEFNNCCTAAARSLQVGSVSV